eukprot:m.24776 g.24776  ORF g.24776 m.24776 type:complete len:75 (+) comp11553_c0_seq2:1361-1585(+)
MMQDAETMHGDAEEVNRADLMTPIGEAENRCAMLCQACESLNVDWIPTYPLHGSLSALDTRWLGCPFQKSAVSG